MLLMLRSDGGRYPPESTPCLGSCRTVRDVLTPRLPDECPPSAARPSGGVFYLYARPSLKLGERLAPTDWVYPWKKHRSEVKGRTDMCEAWAFSLWSSADTLREIREREPWTRAKSIAQLELSAQDGVIMASRSPMGDGHHDWWPPAGQTDHGGSVIEEAVG